MRIDDDRGRGDEPDRHKIFIHVITGIGSKTDAGEQHRDGVTVRRRARGIPRADHAPGAAAILDHHLLAKCNGKLRPDQASHDVDAAARRIRHDQRDGPGRVILRSGRKHLRATQSQNGRARHSRRVDDPGHAISSPRYYKAKVFAVECHFVSPFLFEHDLFRKPVSTFRDHALAPARQHGLHCGGKTGKLFMRFGLFGSATARHGGPDVDSGQGYRQFVEYNVEAEVLGYYSTFLVEHHFTGFGQVSASLALLTWVAARTRTLRLGTAVLVLPWHNPVLLAEQAATIDLLSGGR